MKHYCWLFTLLLCFSCSGHSEPYETLTLGIPNFKPYTYSQNGKIQGSAVRQVEFILKQLPVKYHLKQYQTYTQLIKALKTNQIQGFFLATQNPERDIHAEFSKPIDFNNWAWFSKEGTNNAYEDSEFKISATIGTVEYTNTYRWLVRHGYHALGVKTHEIPTLLLSNKIQAAFLAEKVFENTCKEQAISRKKFSKTIAQKRPFSIYISKRYLHRNPDFMLQLNQKIPDI